MLKRSQCRGQRAKKQSTECKVHGSFHFLIITLCTMFFALYSTGPVFAEDDPLDTMMNETLAYFKPMTGKIIMVENKKVSLNIGGKDSVKTGMRFNILREEAPFRHPVTKEPLGKAEAFIGRLEIREVSADSSRGEIIEGNPQAGDKVRISEIQVDMLFYQPKGTDWNVSDSYYRKLKETGRLHLIDTGIETDDLSKIIGEAKRLHADVALLLTSQTVESRTILKQKLFWVSDGFKFSEIDADIDPVFVKKMKFGEEYFSSMTQEVLLQLDVPFEAKLITISDVNGDGQQDIVIGTEKDIRFYTLGTDLQPLFGGAKIESSGIYTYLWLDSIDLNKNGRDEIIVTAMSGNDIISYIYEFKGTEFVLLYKDNIFLRKTGDRLIAQAYARTEGFSGEVFGMQWEEGGYKKGTPEKLPKGVNIYDFITFDATPAGRLLLAYDDSGFLNVYDSKEMKLWRSKTNSGGFLRTFKRYATSEMIDKGDWAMKDRLFLRNQHILSVKRNPLLEMVRGFGIKNSQIKNLWWNGLAMEEGVLIDNVSGTIFDYAVTGDKIFVLASPMFGIKPQNILKGENPLKTELYVYPVKGF